MLCLAMWFSGHGYSPPQRDALLRQAWLESRFVADANARTGHCLYGWVGARWQALKRFAGTDSCPPWDVQLLFADRELHSGAYSCFFTAPPARAFYVLRQTFGRGGRC